MSSPIPDRSYHLSADVRATLRSDIDADALERLLQLFPPDLREMTLATFVNRPVAVGPDGRIPDVRVLNRISDPVQQALLEEVWQPYWSTRPDLELLEGKGGPPGRELAQRRRASKE